MILAYNFLIHLYYLAVRIAALWNPKAAEWIQGRKQVWEELDQQLHSSNRLIWVHCSSAGEFEQGKPVIENLKIRYPAHKVLVTFFSPSGYRVARNYKGADAICYLPNDTRANARRFLQKVNPELVVFVKYEFWYHHLSAAAFRHIPILLVSAVFRKEQVFFRWYGKFYRQMLHLFRHLFVQDQASLQLLQQHGIQHCSIGGDTRFDRVISIAEHFTPIEGIEAFRGSDLLLVAGSTWPGDEAVLSGTKGLKMILAPHETHEGHLAAIEAFFPGAIRYSAISTVKSDTQVLIIDNVGMLSRLYCYADICYIGGGFTRDGIHNILEAAVFNKPVIFGPEYSKYREAREMIQSGGAVSIQDETTWQQTITSLTSDSERRMQMGEKAGAYVRSQGGGSEMVMDHIQEKRLLTR